MNARQREWSSMDAESTAVRAYVECGECEVEAVEQEEYAAEQAGQLDGRDV